MYHSGPGSQQVSNQWNSTNDWFMMLFNKDIALLVLDGRGILRVLILKTQLQLWKYEVEDQLMPQK
jgi:dipeptidyl-peptidase-4